LGGVGAAAVVQRENSRLSSFNYEETAPGEHDTSGTSVTYKDRVVLESDSYYIGEWNERDQQHGKGV
jgi:hypothetical protein